MASKRKPSIKNKNTKIWIIAAVTLFVAIVTTIIVVFISSNKHISLEDVKKYCMENNYNTSNFPIDTSRLGNDHLIETSTMCKGSSLKQIHFITYYEPVPEDMLTNSVTGDGDMIILGEGEHYLKIYYNPDWNASSSSYHHDYITYGIIDGNTSIAVTARDEATARRILIEIGYPDKEWYTGQR